MKNNVGMIDRAIRIVVAILFGVLFFTHTIAGVLGIILLIVGIVFIITGILGICPLYSLLRVDSRSKK
jgi:hypothetical protein